MKSLIIMLIILAAFILTPTLSNAQTVTAAVNPPVSQPLVREGTMALKLVNALKIGTPANEAEAESTLSSSGIAPKNGWIADYPVTPDIIGELRISIGETADAGKLPVGKDEALKTFEGVVVGFGLAVTPGGSGEGEYGANPDSAVTDEYYTEEGPPVVTYYAPPPDYAYLYTWVPYPFWWWDFWFPGFFVLADFDFRFHHHHHHDFDHDDFVSNHFVDPKTGTMKTIDPAHRTQSGPITTSRTTWTDTSAHSAQTILNKSVTHFSSGTQKGIRSNSWTGTAGARSNAIVRPNSGRVEKSTTNRGFQRSQSLFNAGRVNGVSHESFGRSSAGSFRGSGGSFRSSGMGSFRSGGFSTFHGGGRR